MHLTGVQARSQVTNPLMQIPPNAADAGTTKWAAHPWPTGADMPRTLAKRGSLGDTSDSSIPSQKHHPSLGHAVTSAESNPNHGEPRRTTTIQEGSATPASTRQPLPCWDQGSTQETKEAPSLAKGREILTGAFDSGLGNSPFSSPPKSNPHPPSEVSSA